jgi:5'-3' exonuclease
MTKNEAAVALGKLGKGKQKTITEEDRKARAERMKKVRQDRKPKHNLEQELAKLREELRKLK